MPENLARLKMLYELSMALSGEPMDIFVRIVRMIAELLKVKVVCLSEIREGELYFLSVYVGGQLYKNAGNCPLFITPCATVETTKDIQIYQCVAELFPQAVFLQQHHAYSYCGFPSLDSSSQVIAVTCLLDDKPREYSAEDQEMLRIFGQRIGLELERKHLQDQRESALVSLQQSEQRFSDISQAAGEFIWETDAQLNFTFITERVRETHGLGPDELLGRSAFEFHYAEDIGWIHQYLLDAIRSAKPFRSLEHRVRSVAGELSWIQVSGVPIFDRQGKVVGLRGTSLNITKRKLAEEAQRDSEQRLELALMGADLGLWDWNIQTGTVICNERSASILGYALAELADDQQRWLALLHPDDLGTLLKLLAAHDRRDSCLCEAEIRLFTQAGEWKWVLVRGRVFQRDAAGRPMRAAGTLMDIHARKLLEQRVAELQEQLLHAQRLTTAGELTAMMAHELAQPLAAITNYLGAASVRFGDIIANQPMLDDMMQEMLRLSMRAADVVRGIRDLVRKKESKSEWIDVAGLVEEVLTLVRNERIGHQIQLSLDIAEELPLIWGQRVHLLQLLLNLMLNAMDSMLAVEATRRILTIQAGLNPGQQLVIGVSDTGFGILPGIEKRLFEPFVSSKPEGIGLGLPICRTIAERHGGHISAKSIEGQGATFIVTLPIPAGEEYLEQ